jgi:hypothetical protein
MTADKSTDDAAHPSYPPSTHEPTAVRTARRPRPQAMATALCGFTGLINQLAEADTKTERGPA